MARRHPMAHSHPQHPVNLTWVSHRRGSVSTTQLPPPQSGERGYIILMAGDDQNRIGGNYEGNYDRRLDIKRKDGPDT